MIKGVVVESVYIPSIFVEEGCNMCCANWFFLDCKERLLAVKFPVCSWLAVDAPGVPGLYIHTVMLFLLWVLHLQAKPKQVFYLLSLLSKLLKEALATDGLWARSCPPTGHPARMKLGLPFFAFSPVCNAPDEAWQSLWEGNCISLPTERMGEKMKIPPFSAFAGNARCLPVG